MNAKNIIAENALPLLEENRSIYLDAGSTLLSFAQKIPDMRLSVVTNSPYIGMELSKRSKIQVTFLGGSFNKSAVSVTGNFALQMIEQINIDIAFVATGGVSLENGFSNAFTDECELKSKVIKRAKKVYALFDLSKLSCNLPFSFAALEEVDGIVIDQTLPDEIRAAFEVKKIVIYS